MKIGGRDVGRGHPPMVVAELSANHNGSFERAMQIVEAVARAGAHALKLQTYTADSLTIAVRRDGFVITDPDSLWKDRSLYDLYEEAMTPWEWHRPIMERCRELGLICFSTPFDEAAVDFLQSFGVPAYKIASFENVDLELVRKVAGTGKPVIISTGLATVAELEDAVHTARSAGCHELVLLKCTSAYPATADNANLATMAHLRDLFGVESGVSDHTPGIGVAVAAATLGAAVIEKHVTLRRADGGVDSAFSLEPEELAALVRETDWAWRAVGHVAYGTSSEERGSRVFRRSLYLVKDVRAGEVLSRDNVRSIRPGYGLAPKFLPQVLGRRAARDAVAGTPLTWDLVG